MPGHLYIVATPIGNLRDMTLRAIDALKSSDLIACEDTRRTKILLDEYSIKSATTSYHKFSSKKKAADLIDLVLAGKSVSLVSDAGTPGISDPGQELIKGAILKGIEPEIIPGANAAISALSASGMSTDSFTFEGFIPSSGAERDDAIGRLAAEKRTLVIYEAPHRIVKTLRDLLERMGDRSIAVARELTKKFEEVSRGKISDMLKLFEKRAPKGEFVLVIEGSTGETTPETSESVPLIRDLIAAGIAKSAAVKIVSKRLKVPKNELYRASLDV